MSTLRRLFSGRARTGPRHDKVRDPEMTVHLGPSVPAWAVRLLSTLMAMIAVAVVIEPGSTFGILMIIAILVGIRPDLGFSVILLGGVAAVMLFTEPTVLGAAIAAFLLHASMIAARVIRSVGWGARVELGVFAHAAPAFAVIQIITQVVLQIALGLPTTGAATAWVASAGIIGVAVLMWVTARALRNTGP